MPDAEYTPPAVWTWDKENGGRFAAINRPTSGAQSEKVLPVGKHPFQLYSLGTPNGMKVTIMLEELLAAGHSGAEYDAWLINIGEGDQFSSGFVALNPNSKIPAMCDHSGAEPIRLFESGAMLLHLAEKFGAFIPTDPKGRAGLRGGCSAPSPSARHWCTRQARGRSWHRCKPARDRARRATGRRQNRRC